jgi:23S rRNA (adenine2503-C2)-methyltransferase
MTDKEQLVGLSLEQMEQRAKLAGEPAFRGRQLYHAVYHERQIDLLRITSLPSAFREQLNEQVRIQLPRIDRQFSSTDRTSRFLLSLEDGRRVETVVMPKLLPTFEGEKLQRTTFCVSTQAGCAVDCRFCLTGALGFFRNLTAGEIVGQVLLAMRENSDAEMTAENSCTVHQPPVKGAPPRLNLVFMGQGEPLLNYDNVMQAFRILSDTRGVGIPASRITLSTAGVVPGIERLAREQHRPRLAISLNAPNDDIRTRIMPINKKWPIAELLRACREFPLRPGEKLTFEYVLLAGVNDSLTHARELARLVKPLPCKINLIGWNPGPELGFKTTADADIRAFQAELRERGIANYLRLPRGRDIYAACGQLSLVQSS